MAALVFMAFDLSILAFMRDRPRKSGPDRRPSNYHQLASARNAVVAGVPLRYRANYMPDGRPRRRRFARVGAHPPAARVESRGLYGRAGNLGYSDHPMYRIASRENSVTHCPVVYRIVAETVQRIFEPPGDRKERQPR